MTALDLNHILRGNDITLSQCSYDGRYYIIEFVGLGIVRYNTSNLKAFKKIEGVS